MDKKNIEAIVGCGMSFAKKAEMLKEMQEKDGIFADPKNDLPKEKACSSHNCCEVVNDKYKEENGYMKKNIARVLRYVDVILSGVNNFLGVFFVLIGIGTILFYQLNGIAFKDNNWQQIIFLNVSGISLIVCSIVEVIDFLFMTSNYKARYFFTKWCSYFVCNAVFNWYGKANEMPFNTINVEHVLYFMAGFIFVRMFIRKITEKFAIPQTEEKHDVQKKKYRCDRYRPNRITINDIRIKASNSSIKED